MSFLSTFSYYVSFLKFYRLSVGCSIQVSRFQGLTFASNTLNLPAFSGEVIGENSSSNPTNEKNMERATSGTVNSGEVYSNNEIPD